MRQAERWLAAAEAANHDVIARHPVARQLGWQSDGTTFVTGQDTPWRVEPRYCDQAAALTAHRPHGTLTAWQEAITSIREHIIVQVGAYAGLPRRCFPRWGWTRSPSTFPAGRPAARRSRRWWAELLGRPERQVRGNAHLADRERDRRRKTAQPR